MIFIGQAVHSAGYKITTTIPGTSITQGGDAPTITAYIANLWIFGLLAGGVLAFIMIVYGAIEWTVSAGSQSKIEDAKDRIYQALIGLVLLFGAYLILSFINPNLVRLGEVEKFLQSSDNFPSVNQAGTSTATTAQSICSGCVQIPSTIPHTRLQNDHCRTLGAPLNGRCYIDTVMSTRLRNLASVYPPVQNINGVQTPIWQVTEAFPPRPSPFPSDTRIQGVTGFSKWPTACHNTGSCVDIELAAPFYENIPDKATRCANVASFEDALRKADLRYAETQNAYTECSGVSFESGIPHFHVSPL